jgi:SIR2-like domain
MRDLVLLGAGASADAGVATAFEMTDAIAGRIERSRDRSARDRALAEAFRYVCQRLRAQGGSPNLDVERAFSAVRLLAERDHLEISPFVKRWRRGLDRWQGDSRVPDVLADLAARMIIELRRQLATTSKQISYLRPLLYAAQDPEQLRIVTLNYDRSIEVAGTAFGLPATTGIREWMLTGVWSWPKQGVCLLKLHGSIDWVWVDDPPSRVRLPSRFVTEASPLARDSGEPALIFGLREKLRAEGPFLSALTEFESWLSSAQRLTVIGYSFRDDHVNQIIRRWTYEHHHRELVVVDPSLPNKGQMAEAPMTFRTSLLSHLSQSGPPGGPETKLRLVHATAARALGQLFPL